MNTTTLQFTDETLSAFLDGELPAADMDAVRTALAADAALAGRIATLARVDALVKQQAQLIDGTPMPAGVLALLADDGAGSAAKVVQGPWQRRRQPLLVTLALAASLVVAVAIGVRYQSNEPALPALADYSSALDTTPSGTTADIGSATLLGRFSFRTRADRFCRQYQLASASERSENIACRNDNGWEVVASIALPPLPADNLQPAGASAELDAALGSFLDNEMQGAALDLATEQELMGHGWKP